MRSSYEGSFTTWLMTLSKLEVDVDDAARNACFVTKDIVSIDCSLDTFRCRRSLQGLLNLKKMVIFFFIVGMYLSIPMQFIETRDTYHIILLCVSTITYFAIICRPKGPLVPPA